MARTTQTWGTVAVLLAISSICAAQGNVYCVSDCSSVLDGSYQACHTCALYVTCEDGTLRHRPCPDGLVWDDFQRSCQYTSSSCSGGANCVSNCLGLPDGFYPACDDTCSSFVECTTEMVYHNLACPEGTVWDDQAKNCETTSSSCDDTQVISIDPASISETHHQIDDIQDVVTDESCVTSCSGLQDGHYQSCLSCSEFVSCLSTRTISSHSCTSPLEWDDNLKRCSEESSTCSVTAGCVNDCSGQPSGNYQSCRGCHVYVSCANGVLYDNRPCPNGLFWDDNAKQCFPSSSTCPAIPTTTQPPTTTIIYDFSTTTDPQEPDQTDSATPSSTEPVCNCVGSCYGMADGQYQSCLGCEYYVTCINGVMQDDTLCSHEQVWDDILKSCMWESSTCYLGCNTGTPHEFSTTEVSVCNCIGSCYGVPDGHYQSCDGCEYYVTCIGDMIHDERVCSYGRVWDDNLKRCLWESSTCFPGCNTVTPDGGGTDRPTGYTTGRPPRYTTGRPPRYTTNRPTRYTTDRPTRYTTDRGTDRPAGYTTDRHTGYTTGRPPRYTTDRPPRYTTDRPWPTWTTTSDDVTPTGEHVCNCISSCHGLINRHYQSCRGCEYFATCAGGQIWDGLLCTYGRVWDDHLKRCVWQSSTCYPGCDEVTPTPTSCECVESCNGLPDRLYQSCEGCESYVLCVGGEISSTHHCPSGLIWDDLLKRCDHVSSTCHDSCFEDGSESEEEDEDSHEDSTEEEDSGGHTPGGHSKGKSKGKDSHEHSGSKSKKSKAKSKESGSRSKSKGKKGKNKRRRHRSIEGIIDESKELFGKPRGDEKFYSADDEEARSSNYREEYISEIGDLIAAAQNLK